MLGKLNSLLICLILFSLQITAWWDIGHMMTAQVAELYLQSNNQNVLDWANSLIADFNPLTDGCSNTFVEASVWADDIKEPGVNYLDNWHYTSFPINKEGLMIIIDPIIMETNSQDSMRRARLVFTNPKNIHAEHTWAKAQMIRYILHVIGDMHQPLHNSNFYNGTFQRGDSGGNMVNVTKIDGTQVNLHAYWDEGAGVLQPYDGFLVRPLNESATFYMEQWAQRNMIKHSKASFGDTNMIDYIQWTQEEYRQASDITYPFFANTSQINQEYQDLAANTVERNIVLGGYRLAAFLTDIYESIQKTKSQVSFVEGRLNSLRKQDNQKASVFGQATTQDQIN